jgi:DNA-binding transcriptional LysR family regulator
MGGLIPLRQEHPKIHVELVLGSAPSDLMRNEADLALRMFREQNPALITRKIGGCAWSVYASRAYVERTGFALGTNLEGGKLVGNGVVGYVGAAARSTAALWLVEHSRPEDIVLTGGSVTAVVDAVKAGFGLSVLPCYTAKGDQSLVRLTPSVVARNEAFLVIPPDHRDTLRVRLVMDALIALFERERAILDGLV